MPTKKNTKEHAQYLSFLKDAVASTHKLHALCDVELAICSPLEPEEADLRKAATLRKAIARACTDMRAVEAAVSHAFGVEALLGQDADDCIRVALALLAAKAVTHAVQIPTVSMLAEMAAGTSNDPVSLMTIHEAMQRGGILRPHVGVDARHARNVGEFRDPALAEQALVQLAGCREEGAVEFIELARARTLFADAGAGKGYGV